MVVIPDGCLVIDLFVCCHSSTCACYDLCVYDLLLAKCKGTNLLCCLHLSTRKRKTTRMKAEEDGESNLLCFSLKRTHSGGFNHHHIKLIIFKLKILTDTMLLTENCPKVNLNNIILYIKQAFLWK